MKRIILLWHVRYFVLFILASFFTFDVGLVYSQAVQWDYRVHIPKGTELFKITSVTVTTKLSSASFLIEELPVNSSRKTFLSRATNGVDVLGTKLKVKDTIFLPKYRAASVIVDKSDRSILHVNFLNEGNELNPDSIEYQVKLVNRGEPRKFNFSTWEAGAITIPFRYRPGFNKNKIRLSDELTSDFNIAAYIGKANGKLTYYYRQYEDREPNIRSITNGLFFGISAFEVDSASTSTAKFPLKTTRKIGAVAVGYGLSYTINNFKIGVFIGTDLAIGRYGYRWDYNYLPWVGFGFGFNTNFLGGLIGKK